MSKKKQAPAGQPLEDRALKDAAAMFGEELLPLLGIRKKVRRIAPTEQVQLLPMDFLEDFNYEMEDGSWIHLEFESDRIVRKDLQRFRTYESLIAQQFGVKVATYVICSSRAQDLKSELKEILYTYRVKVIRLKDQDADQVLPAVEQCQSRGKLKRSCLLQMLLTPLMDGHMPQTERISRGIKILHKEQKHLKRDELARMEAVLYTLAMKFLTTAELQKVKEMMNMTVLGEMILQDGIEQGIERGIKQGARAERADSVLDILQDAGSIPQEIEHAIYREQDMERLKRWRRLALRVNSVEEFRQKYLDL